MGLFEDMHTHRPAIKLLSGGGGWRRGIGSNLARNAGIGAMKAVA